MLDDHNAEHIPGCNMAFWKWALDEIHGFDPQFRAAGDDVDVCWRLLQRGRRIAFSHSGFVWHYRRSTIPAYLKQQRGYGVAESLLRRKHPEYFNSLGGMRWRGRIYSPSKIAGFFGKFVIYHGMFGSALFQTLYTPEPSGLLAVLTSLEWHVVFTAGAVLLATVWPALWPLPVLTLLASLSMATVAAVCVELPPWQIRWWSRPLVAVLYLLQPVVRGWPKYARRLRRSETPQAARETVRALAAQYEGLGSVHTLNYWNEKSIERFTFLEALLDLLDRDQWQSRADSGWDEFDVTIYGDRFTKVLVKTVAENHGGEKRLLRARLEGGWTLLGKISFFAFAAGMCLAARLWWTLALPSAQVPLWMLWCLTVLPLMLICLWASYLYLRTRRSLRLATALLDLCARELKLIKLSAPRKFVASA